MTETPFNINNCIKVRLTDKGREMHRAKYEANLHNRYLRLPYRPPTEDNDGWSKWQAWDFMSEFGDQMGMGFDLPTETNIIFITE